MGKGIYLTRDGQTRFIISQGLKVLAGRPFDLSQHRTTHFPPAPPGGFRPRFELCPMVTESA